MLRLRRFGLTSVLTLLLATSVMAGDMPCGIVEPPPPPPPPATATAPGEIPNPGDDSDVDPLLNAALIILQGVLSLL